jgi:hypothetical protein
VTRKKILLRKRSVVKKASRSLTPVQQWMAAVAALVVASAAERLRRARQQAVLARLCAAMFLPLLSTTLLRTDHLGVEEERASVMLQRRGRAQACRHASEASEAPAVPITI